MSTTDDLTVRCDDCGTAVGVGVIPREGTHLRCDCGHVIALGDMVAAFPEPWLSPGPLAGRTFACAECDAEVSVGHVFDHWADEHGRELVQDVNFYSAREDACEMCHKLLRLPVDAPGAVLHFEHAHDLRLLSDGFYEEVEPLAVVA